MSGITVCIPSIPPRSPKLARCLTSITEQTLQPEAIIVEIDHEGDGAPTTRNRALMKVTTEWVAFIDDDDWFKPEHLETLYKGALEHQADYVYSYYEIFTHLGQYLADYDPVLGHFGKMFDPADPVQTTITTLVRTELAQAVGFLHPPSEERLIHGQVIGEDYQFTLGCIERGAKIVHVPARTWYWGHGGDNTSGRPWNKQESWAS